MIPLPEWAPNVHPILVHFPIALLVMAVLFDGASSRLEGTGAVLLQSINVQSLR